MSAFRSVVALSGGVGGARMVHGLAMNLGPEALSVVVNTGDDFRHWGLYVCPDLDTVMYTLARLSDDERGWGLCDESFAVRAAMERYGAPTWFSLGDRDLATHLVRTAALAEGRSLTQVTHELCRALGVAVTLLPMADAPRPTRVRTVDGQDLGFQEWFVRERAPRVARVEYQGTSAPAPAVCQAIAAADLVVIAPSNPYVSIDPMLELEGVAQALRERRVVAVSPIVAGRAVKGPLAEMLASLDGAVPSAAAVFAHYRRRYGALISGVVVESGDEAEVLAQDPGARVLGTDIVMRDLAARGRLARRVLEFAETLP